MHIPVMPAEVLSFIPVGCQKVFDLTFGLGGHSHLILEHFPGVTVQACDMDIDIVQSYQHRFGSRLHLEHRASDEFLAEKLAQAETADVILADLGVSSVQLDSAERGFSMQKESDLDMRMNRNQTGTAQKIVNTYSEKKLKELLYTFGEERFAPQIASAIAAARSTAPITTTRELADLVSRVKPASRFYKRHPATKTFMALRIEVNHELARLEKTLALLPQILNAGGRAVFIAFHSLEDRQIKQVFRSLCLRCTCPPEQPVCSCGRIKRFTAITKKPLTPGEAEMASNRRSRSAKMRVIEKCYV